MILSDKDIEQAIRDGKIDIDPLISHNIQSASLDIRLGSQFSIVKSPLDGFISMSEELEYEIIDVKDRYILLPGQFVLATTKEYIRIDPSIAAMVEGRSSLGRMGLFIQNAGWIDPGFEGQITLELFNANHCAIKLEPGRRIGQLVFSTMSSPADRPYNGKYQKQTGATGSRIFLDKDWK